jgi:hypothetical protein
MNDYTAPSPRHSEMAMSLTYEDKKSKNF